MDCFVYGNAILYVLVSAWGYGEGGCPTYCELVTKKLVIGGFRYIELIAAHITARYNRV